MQPINSRPPKRINIGVIALILLAVGTLYCLAGGIIGSKFSNQPVLNFFSGAQIVMGLLASTLGVLAGIAWAIMQVQPRAENVTVKPGSGTFSVEVVGESYYQQNLEAICGKRTAKGEHKLVTATLILDDSNPHDNQAVRVEIEGKIVGHLSREMARKYRASRPEKMAQCGANIRGGWRRKGNDLGDYGVWLDLVIRD